jgi:aminoglycoside 3-N-acetyltransferase
MDELDVHQLVEQLLSLGVRPGGVLLVHTALSRVRPVEGGPLGLIQALSDALGPEGTLAMPTMTAGDSVFDPRTTPTQDMGVTAERFWRLAGVLRSDHPSASFAARGPRVAEICAPQPLQPPHGPDSPVGRVWRRARSSRDRRTREGKALRRADPGRAGAGQARRGAAVLLVSTQGLRGV